MSLLAKLLQVLKKADFTCPPKAEILIFDDGGSDILSNLILYKMEYSVLHARYEKFHISIEIFYNFMRNFIFKYLRYRKCRSLYFVYLLSCMEYIKPKVVLTFIDNNFLFHMLSSAYPEADFFTIQNGTRRRISLPSPRLFGTVFPISNYVCFGNNEMDFFRQQGYVVDKFHPVGSLIGGYYKSKTFGERPETNYDLCLVSQWRHSIMVANQLPDFKTSVIILDAFIKKFIGETKLRLCIATCSCDRQEEDYFKGIYGNHAPLIKFNRQIFSTYSAMSNSSVIVSLTSTAAYEAFGWGKKVLFCNFSDDRSMDFPVQGFWSLADNRYESFKSRLEYLLSLDHSKYVELTREAVRYVMNYDFQMPAHMYLRRLIFDRMNN